MSACSQFNPNQFMNTICCTCYKSIDRHKPTDISPLEGRKDVSGTTKESPVIYSSPDNNKDGFSVNDKCCNGSPNTAGSISKQTVKKEQLNTSGSRIAVYQSQHTDQTNQNDHLQSMSQHAENCNRCAESRPLVDEIIDLGDNVKILDPKQLEERLLETIARLRDLQIQAANELFSRRKQEVVDILHRNENEFETEKSRLYEDIEQLKRETTDLTKKGEATDDQVQSFEQRLEEIRSNFNTIQDKFVVIDTSPAQIGPHTIGVAEAKPKTLLSEDHRKKINQFFDDSKAIDHHWQLIYKGQKDGFKSEDFHRCCDGKGSTITLVQTTTGLLFGGYAAVSWSSDGNHKCDPQAFLFTLINPYQIPETKFKIKTDLVEYAVVHNKDLGPVFGDRDIVIVSSSNVDGPGPSFSRFPTAYSSLTETDSRLFGDARPFIVNELEVYAEEFRNNIDSRTLMEKTLCTRYESQITLSTDEIQHGTFDVCDKHDVILLSEEKTLKLFDCKRQIDERPWANIRDAGFVTCIHWCSFLDSFLILSRYRLYTLSLKLNQETLQVEFDQLTPINPIRACSSETTTARYNNTREILRFITTSQSLHDYLFLNRDYRVVEQVNTNSWQVHRQWSKQNLEYDEQDEIRLITCSRDGSYLAMNIRLNRRAWFIDLRKIDVHMTPIKRIRMPNDSSSLYHKIQMPFGDEHWLVINERNQFHMVSTNPQDESITSTRADNVQAIENVAVNLRFFRNNKYLLVGTVISNGKDKQGVFNFYKVDT